MQKDLRDLVDRYFQDIVETFDTGSTSTVQNNNPNTALNNNIQNIRADCSEIDSNEISSTLTFPTSQQNISINTLQQNSSNNVSENNIQQNTDVIIPIEYTVTNVMEDTVTSLEDTIFNGIIQNINTNTLHQDSHNNVPDNNNPQETNEIIPIVETEINVVNATVSSPKNTTSIDIIPILNSQINIMADNTTTPQNSTSVQHPTRNSETQMSQTTALPISLTTETITISKTGKPSKTKTKTQTTKPQNNTPKTQNRITVQKVKRKKQPYTPYEMTLKLRDRVNCIILKETFFSSLEQPRIGRGQNTTPICIIRDMEELSTDEVDLYINHLNKQMKLCKKNDVIILNVDFYIMA